jgi:hypothetical protein
MYKIQYYWKKRSGPSSKFFCFSNNVSNLYNNSVVEKINGMAYIFEISYYLSIIHFSDVTLLFEQWIIFKNLQFILLFLNIWTLTFYCFRLKNVLYILWDFRDILINCFLKQIVNIFFNNAYYQESYILIIEYSSVVTVAEWLDESFESQSRL